MIEAKSTSDDAWVVAGSEQVSRYRGKYKQVLVTNYRDFVLAGRDALGLPVKLETYRLSSSEKAFWSAAAHPDKAAQTVGDGFLEFLKRMLLQTDALDAVGRIVETLERTGQRENTLIFVLGDNGATTECRAGLNQQYATAGHNTPFRGYKFSTFDGGMHVPGVMNWLGHVPAGKTIHEIVMSADVLPTVCHLTGAPLPSDRTIDGKNLWLVVTQGAPSPHEYLCWSEGPQLAILRGHWKLVLNGVTHDGTQDGNKPLTGDDAVFLSNLSQDPGETKNLRHDHPEITDQLQTLVHQWRQEVEKN